jgi:type IV pilus assembly protein PilB
MPIELGELLLNENMVSPQQVQDALNHQRKNGGRLGQAFVVLGFVRDEEITSLLSRQYGVPSINLEHFEVDPAIIRIIPAETARKYQLLPLSRSGATLTIAMADPTNRFAMDDIKFMMGYNVEPVLASETAVEEAIDRYYGSTRSSAIRRDEAAAEGGRWAPIEAGARARAVLAGPTLGVEDMAAIGGLSEIDLGKLAGSADAAPLIKLTNVLLVECLKRGASAIHVEPYEKAFRVRFRIDGILYDVMALPMKLRDPLISRIKIMAQLDIAEKRLPQDGRIRIVVRIDDRSRELDFRVSVQPTLWGETIVMRRLDRSSLVLDTSKLGFEWHSLERFHNALGRRQGVVLVTGPRGSGKTTTLYSAIAALNGPDTHVVTVEDPIELELPGVNQVAIQRTGRRDAAAVLRSLHHMDADVVLVSDIGESDVARAAFSLAERGHLVLSTLPASDASSAVVRLVHMGLPPHVLATLSLVEAQRLVRRICPKCRFDDTANVPGKTLLELGFTRRQIGSVRVMKGRGCTACHGTGYKGQVGLFETMELTEGIRELILAGAGATELRDKAIEEGMLTLRRSGLEKIKAGVTTVEEVLRETVGSAPSPDRVAPSRDVERGPAAELLVAQLASANAEIETLRHRLREEITSSALGAQLANARAEIETLRKELFQLHSYRIAYERLKAGDGGRPGGTPTPGP